MKIQKATAGTQSPMNDLLQLAYLVFSNRDMAQKKLQRNMQNTQMIKGQSHSPTGGCLWPVIRAPGTLHKASVSCVDKKGGAGGRIVIDVSFANSQGIGRGNQMLWEQWGPSAIDSFTIKRRLMGPEGLKWLCLQYYLHN